MLLYIVGIRVAGNWDICGVFDDEGDAINACTSYCHFIGPITLNEELPEEQEDWPGAYYPRLTGEKED